RYRRTLAKGARGHHKPQAHPGALLDESGTTRPCAADAVSEIDDGHLRAALAGAPEPDRLVAGRPHRHPRQYPAGARIGLRRRHAAPRPEARARGARIEPTVALRARRIHYCVIDAISAPI